MLSKDVLKSFEKRAIYSNHPLSVEVSFEEKTERKEARGYWNKEDWNTQVISASEALRPRDKLILRWDECLGSDKRKTEGITLGEVKVLFNKPDVHLCL